MSNVRTPSKVRAVSGINRVARNKALHFKQRKTRRQAKEVHHRERRERRECEEEGFRIQDPEPLSCRPLRPSRSLWSKLFAHRSVLHNATPTLASCKTADCGIVDARLVLAIGWR
jgi:hypothetical protein